MELQLILKGNTLKDIATQASAFIAGLDEETPKTKPAVKTATKKAAAPVVEESLELPEDVEVGDTDETDFMAMGDDEVEASKAAAPKYTDKDVNQAALTHAKKHGKAETMKILKKKFKVESLIELKPAQYAEFMNAVKV